MTLAAGQLVEPDVETIGQPGGQTFRRSTGQREQFAAGQGHADNRRHILPQQAQTKTGALLDAPGKHLCPPGNGSKQRTFADAIGTGQADDFAGCNGQIERLGRRLLPADDQLLSAEKTAHRAPFNSRCTVSSNKPNKSLASGVPPTV